MKLLFYIGGLIFFILIFVYVMQPKDYVTAKLIKVACVNEFKGRHDYEAVYLYNDKEIRRPVSGAMYLNNYPNDYYCQILSEESYERSQNWMLVCILYLVFFVVVSMIVTFNYIHEP